jgi:hypothetical protein
MPEPDIKKTESAVQNMNRETAAVIKKKKEPSIIHDQEFVDGWFARGKKALAEADAQRNEYLTKMAERNEPRIDT